VHGVIPVVPLWDFVAATSVGIVAEQPLLDLSYEEDSACEVDMNIVMTGDGRLIEVQGTPNQPFARDLDQLLDLATRCGSTDCLATQPRERMVCASRPRQDTNQGSSSRSREPCRGLTSTSARWPISSKRPRWSRTVWRPAIPSRRHRRSPPGAVSPPGR
jgi:hypothetical protein